tara:strand:- start:8586 stop:8912 length:327 start_codon:yes stop_codon:yes gene_type:complete
MANYKKTHTTLKGIRYSLLIADTDAKRKKGLSGLDKIPYRTGMVFTYDKDVQHGFTFSDVSFPLTIIFLDDKFQPIELYHTKAHQSNNVVPKNKFRHVIEIPKTNLHL